MARYTSGRQMTNTSFRNGGRIAGYGMSHDNYGDESGNPDYEKRWICGVRLPNDDVKPEDLNGPVIIVQEGRKKDADN